MNFFYKILSLALVIALAGILENVKAVGTIKIAQTQNVVHNKAISLILPMTVDMVLKDKSSLTGNLTAFDPKRQIIQISKNGNSPRSFQINQIQQITFRQAPLTYPSDGQLNIIRGRKIIWIGIPLNGFQVLDYKEGKASLDLAPIMNPKQLNSILSQAEENLYTVHEIQFDLNGKMAITVIRSNR